MKKIAFFLTLLTTLAFTGCFETTEQLSVGTNGSGVYQVNIDMSRFFEFVDMMKAMDTTGEASNKGATRERDTLIYMKSYTDTAAHLSKKEKELMKDATMRLVMKEKEKVFTINIKYPYAKLNDIQKIITLHQSNTNLIGKTLQDKSSVPEEDQSAYQAPAMPDFNSVYDVIYQNGLLERKLNAERLQKFKDNENYAMMLQMKDMFAASSMNTVLQLPRPAKKAEGPNVTLSADKKTVTIKATLGDVLDHPDLLAYHIEY